MEARLQRRVQRYGWDRAETYEEDWRAAIAPAHDRLLARAALAPGERVLDVACGTGLLSLRAAALVRPGGSVTAVDLSDRMVERTRERAAAAGVPGLELRSMDAEQLDFADSSFDVVLNGLGLMYSPDPDAALREARRVLRPGGRAAIAVWGERRACAWHPVFSIVETRLCSEVCPLFFRLGTGDALAACLRRAGFAQVASERVPATMSFASEQHAARAALQGGALALAWSRFDSRTRDEVVREYVAAIAPFRSGEGYELPAEFAVAVGQRPGSRDDSGGGVRCPA